MIPRALKRLLHRATLKDPAYRFLFAPGPPGEAVAFDCETTGLDWRRDDICSIAAVRIKGDRILTSERFEAVARPRAEMRAEAIKVHLLRESDVEIGAPIETVIPRFLAFIGGRPLVGYYLEFDVGMVNKYLRGLLGIELPNPMIEVSKLYYERKYGDAPPGSVIDLSFRAILNDLDLPALDQHDAFNDALMTGMMYLKLRDLKERGVRIARLRDVEEPQTTLA
ncbi:3'-5' exonuclease [Methylocella sp.]|jgi:DNA polymerase-3 subunit epsilon|uniref:3'-5' exonuclease n=1 Tax=Methylocella sp. TaxID=1978226 RepID=UPI003C244D34